VRGGMVRHAPATAAPAMPCPLHNVAYASVRYIVQGAGRVCPARTLAYVYPRYGTFAGGTGVRPARAQWLQTTIDLSKTVLATTLPPQVYSVKTTLETGPDPDVQFQIKRDPTRFPNRT